jgi:hypothetical protein
VVGVTVTCPSCGREIVRRNVSRHARSHDPIRQAALREKRLAASFDLCDCGNRKMRKAPYCRDCRWSFETPEAVIVARFWAKVDRSAGPTGCWPWRGASMVNGYGRFMRRYAHRVSYELAFGPIPAGRMVCHHCDNRPCVNPGHLYAGTASDNMRDAMEHGNWKKPPSRWRHRENAA